MFQIERRLETKAWYFRLVIFRVGLVAKGRRWWPLRRENFFQVGLPANVYRGRLSPPLGLDNDLVRVIIAIVMIIGLVVNDVGLLLWFWFCNRRTQ